MKDFVRGEMFEGRFRDACDRNRISDCIEDLDRIANFPSISGMAVHNCCHISASEILFRNVLCQSNLFKKRKFHRHLPLSRYRVMNFVIPLLDSVIQTDFTCNPTPLGPVKEALIS